MKFKRYLVFIITIMLAVCLVGCGEANTEKAVANNIEKSTAKLDGIIERLDEMNYEDIIIDDISPFGVENTSISSKLEKTKYYSVGTGETKTYPTSILTANKSKDNAKFVSTDKIDLDKTSGTKFNTTNAGNQNCTNGNCYSNKNYSATRTSNYKPRYVNETSESFSRDGLNNYLILIENVYNTCSDCISCDAECKNEMSKIKQNISDCKVLSSKLKDGSIKLSESEIDSCNNCLNDLQACSYKLNLTKDNINLKEKNVTKLKDNLSKNLISLQDAYSKLLSALESRLDYLCGCNDCINSLCDIINKTNVNIAEAEKNKSNEQDIVRNEEKLKGEQAQNVDDVSSNNYLTNNISKKSSNSNQNKNYTAKNTTKKFNNNNSSNSKKIDYANKTDFNNQGKITKNNTNYAKKASNSNNFNENNKENKNLNNNNNLQNRQNDNQNFNNTQNANLESNMPNTNYGATYNPAPNGNNFPYGYNYQNGYGYPYNYGYGNTPYPPRNIDTYRTITKNIFSATLNTPESIRA